MTSSPEGPMTTQAPTSEIPTPAPPAQAPLVQAPDLLVQVAAQQQVSQIQRKNKATGILVFLCILIFVALLSGGAFWYWWTYLRKKKEKDPPEDDPPKNNDPEPTIPPDNGDPMSGDGVPNPDEPNECDVPAVDTDHFTFKMDNEGIRGFWNTPERRFHNKDKGSFLGHYATLRECTDKCLNDAGGCKAVVYADFGAINQNDYNQRGCWRFYNAKDPSKHTTTGYVTAWRIGAPR